MKVLGAERFFQVLEKFYVNSKAVFDDVDASLYRSGVETSIGYARATEALFRLARRHGFSRVPTVDQILTEAGAIEADPKVEATLLAQQILERISRGDSARAMKETEAILGPLGMQVIQILKGMTHLCETVGPNDHATFIAQTRDTILGMKQREKMGNHSLALESGDFDVVKFIEDAKNG